MNAKHEKLQDGQSADVAEKSDLGAIDAGATGMTEVTRGELDKVEGGLSAAALAYQRQQLLSQESAMRHIGTR